MATKLRTKKKSSAGNEVKFIVGRTNLSCTVFVPWDCRMNCHFCNTKKEYSTLNGINQMNVLTDLELMFNTFRILFYKDSTEGFESQMPWLAEEEKKAEEEELHV